MRGIVRGSAAVAVLAVAAGSALGQAGVSFHNLPAGGMVDIPLALTQGQVAAWMTTPLGNYGTNFATPDTIVEIRNAGGLIRANDDAGADGRGAGAVSPVRGSLVRYGVTVTDAYTLRTRGFSGGDAGPYALTSVLWHPGTPGDFAEVEPNNSIATAQVLPVPFGSAIFGFGSLTPTNDFDYFAVLLNPGEVLTAFTVPLSGLPNNFTTVDTRLDIRNAADGIIITNDDAGGDAVGFSTTTARGSALRYESITGGLTHVVVRPFSSTNQGDYMLVLSVVPAPGAAALMLMGLPLAARRRRA